jgi:hypothetical protein
MRREMRAVTIQLHRRELSSHYEESSNIPTPKNTKLFLRSGQQLDDVGPDSVLEGREDLLRQVAEEVYLNRCRVPSRYADTKTMSKYVPVLKTNPVITRGSDMFGGEFPNNSVGLREVKTKWMKVDRRI